MKRLILAATVLLGATLPALPVSAQGTDAAPAAPETTTTIAPEIDRLLWCGSAFYWLAGSAEDSGDSEEAEMYDRWSKRLLQKASAALTTEGYPPDLIETMITRFDEKALVDLSGDSPPYDVTTCPSLLGEFR